MPMQAFSKTQKNILLLTAFLIPVAYFALNMFVLAGSVLIPMVCVLFIAGFYKDSYRLILKNPVALVAFFLIVDSVLALFYGQASWHQKLVALKHYLPLLYLPILMVFFQKNERYSTVALHAFFFGCLVYMLMNVFNALNLLPLAHWLHRQPIDIYLFERANYALALAIFLSLQWTFSKGRRLHVSIFYGCLTLFLLWSLLFVSTVRTDYVLTLLAVMIFAVQKLNQLRFRWTVLAFILCILSLLCLYHVSAHFKQGMGRIAHGIVAFEHKDPNTSSGLRLAFTQHSLTLIHQKPIVGYGTGGFSNAYASHHFIGVDGTPTTLSQPLDQPHNQYIYFMVEQGAVGLVLWLGLLILAFKQSYTLPLNYKHFNQAIVLLMAANSFFMSTLFYHNSAYTFSALLALCLAQQGKKIKK